MTAKVSVENVARVAELAHLELTPDETGHMLHDLNAILDYVAQLSELDTTGVAVNFRVLGAKVLFGRIRSFRR